MLLKKQKLLTITDKFLIPKTMWYIIKSAALRNFKHEDMRVLKIDRKDALNNYLLSVAKKNYY